MKKFVVLCIIFVLFSSLIVAQDEETTRQEYAIITSDNADQLVQLGVYDDGITGVYAIAYSPDGLMIATVSTDKTLRLWDVETAEQLAVIDDYKGSVNRVMFSPDGRFIATLSQNLYVHVFGVPTSE